MADRLEEIYNVVGVPTRLRQFEDPESAPVDAKLKPLLAFVRKLACTPSEMTQDDADAVFEAGWDEQALHDAIVVTARAGFKQRLVEGHGFIPISKEVAKQHAARGGVGRRRPVSLPIVALAKACVWSHVSSATLLMISENTSFGVL